MSWVECTRWKFCTRFERKYFRIGRIVLILGFLFLYFFAEKVWCFDWIEVKFLHQTFKAWKNDSSVCKCANISIVWPKLLVLLHFINIFGNNIFPRPYKLRQNKITLTISTNDRWPKTQHIQNTHHILCRPTNET